MFFFFFFSFFLFLIFFNILGFSRDSLVVFFAVSNPCLCFLRPGNPHYYIVDFKMYTSVRFCKLINFCKYINRHKNTVCDSTQSSFPTPKLIFMHALKTYIGMGRNGTIHIFLKSNKFAQLECFCK